MYNVIHNSYYNVLIVNNKRIPIIFNIHNLRKLIFFF
jgi:hypothetical protein